jgi:F-type H+-transporting ATPase subunit epsilon
MTLTVRVIAPDKTVWDAPAEEVILPSTTGQLGILSGHAPLLTALEAGVMRVREGKGWLAIALMGGFAEVDSNEVTILVNGAERGDTIDKDVARATFSEAQARLAKAEQGDDKQERYQATQDFKRSRARLQAAGEVVQI